MNEKNPLYGKSETYILYGDQLKTAYMYYNINYDYSSTFADGRGGGYEIHRDYGLPFLYYGIIH